MVRALLLLMVIFAAGCGGGGTGDSGNSGDDGGGGDIHGQDISNTTTDSSKPTIAADSGGSVYVIWEEEVSRSSKVYLVTSNNSGSTFTTAKSLTDGCPNKGADSEDVSIATGGNGSLYLAWIDSWKPSINASEVKFFREEDSTCNPVSTTFSAPRNAYSPHIAERGYGNIHLVWTEDAGGGQRDIFYKHSNDNGTTFTPSNDAMNISSTSSDSSEPLVGFEGSLNVNVVWVEDSGGERSVVFSISTDLGSSFSYPPQTISDTTIDSYCPVMATAGEGKTYIAYRGGDSIYFTRWQSAALSFSTPVSLSPYSINPSCPEIAVGSSRVIYVVWSDSGGIWVATSSDNGYTFAPPKDISFLIGTSSSPKIVMDGSYVNIAWLEDGVGSGDIFFSASIDHGRNFSSPRNLSNSSTPSSSPVIASDGRSYLYVAWVEGSTGRREIYHLRDLGARGISSSSDKSLARFLDISGDGKSDIVIGAPLADNAGKVYVFSNNSIQSIFPVPEIPVSSANYTLSGGSTGDQFGYSVAIGGDINGDGYGDILVGAPYADDNATDNGRVYIYYGGPSMNTTPGVVIRGSGSNDHLGLSVSPAGDVNRDGFDDILIGAPDKYQSGTPYAGVAFIFYGGPLLGDKPGYPDLSAEDADVILKGENSYDGFGGAVSWAGDFNGDDYDDVIIGAPMARVSGNAMGRAYIFYGGPSMNSLVDVRITAGNPLDHLGGSVARGGDINGDGYGDVIVGAPWADVNSGDNRGKAYIVYGDRSVSADIDLANTDVSMLVLSGLSDMAFMGTSVGYAGDVNNDGYGDIVVGGKYLGTDDTFKGRAYVYLGGPFIDITPDATVIGENREDRFGTAVAGAGDVDGDGYYDVLVGAFLFDGGGTDRGKVYLYLGDALLDSNADATFRGDVDSGQAGYSLYHRLP